MPTESKVLLAVSHSASPDASTTLPRVTYRGEHPDGCHRVVVDGLKALVSGELYSLNMANGVLTGIPHLISVTPSYELGTAEGQLVDLHAHDPKTNVHHHIVGKLRHISSRPPAEPLSANNASTNSIPTCVAVPNLPSPEANPSLTTQTLPMAAGPTEPVSSERSSRENRLFKRDLESVCAQRDAGFDPLVSIDFVSRIAKRSRATLYREFGSVLPMPTKIGKRSLLRYSAVEAYMSGHHGTANYASVAVLSRL